nr:hypothetical protein [Enterococcus avium]
MNQLEVTAFPEVVEVMKYRKHATLKDIAEHIGKSATYTRQVIEGHQNGPAAQEDKKKIAKFLGIVLAS